MTEQSFVWEVGGGGDESPHSVADWGAVEAAIAGVASANEGVLPRMLNELAPSTQAGATQIRIASGWAIVDGHPYHNDGNEDFTPVTPSAGTTGRRVVLRADWSAQTVRIVEISSADGTAAIPALTQTSGTTYEVPICQYTVTTGGAISAFVDEREFCGANIGFDGGALRFVEAGVYKGFWALGTPSSIPTYATTNQVGLGCTIREATSGGVAAGGTAATLGTWIFSTGTSGSAEAGVLGPRSIYSADPTMVWRGKINSNAASGYVALVGWSTSTSLTDANGLIAVRISTTGTIVGVCDSGGTETTRDSGVTPDGSEHSIRIEIREAGTIVRFYLDGIQIGANVTTNIPTGGLIAVNGESVTASTNVAMECSDWFGWREV